MVFADRKQYGLRAINEESWEARDLVEPLFLADRRVVIGPLNNHVRADGVNERLQSKRFSLLRLMAVRSDTIITYEDYVTLLYGYIEPTTAIIESFKKSFSQDVGDIRSRLGEELGDREYGAIRSLPGVGYIALSEL
jgi:DNA-binding response OmpR family regulator